MPTWMEGLELRYPEGCTMLHQSYLPAHQLFRFLEDLSFIHGKNGRYTCPRNMELHVYRCLIVMRGFALVGDLSSHEIYEVLTKAEAQGLLVRAAASGGRAARALHEADRRQHA